MSFLLHGWTLVAGTECHSQEHRVHKVVPDMRSLSSWWRTDMRWLWLGPWCQDNVCHCQTSSWENKRKYEWPGEQIMLIQLQKAHLAYGKRKGRLFGHVRSASGLLPRKEINSSLRIVRIATCGEGGFSWGLSSLGLEVSYEHGQKARKRKGKKKNKGEEEKKEGRMMDRRKGEKRQKKEKARHTTMQVLGVSQRPMC